MAKPVPKPTTPERPAIPEPALVLRDRSKVEKLRADAIHPDGVMEATLYRVMPHVGPELDEKGKPTGKKAAIPNKWDVKRIVMRGAPAESETLESGVTLAVARSCHRVYAARHAFEADTDKGP